MHPLFRAGLASLVFLVFLTSGTWAAPVPHLISLSVASNPPSTVPFTAYFDSASKSRSAEIIDDFPTSNAPGALAPVGSGTQIVGAVIDAKPEVVTLYRRNKFTDFFHHIFHKIGEGFHKMAEGIKHVAQKIGDGIKHVAQKIASGVKHVAQKIASGVKHVALKIASGVKHVAQKIASGVRTAVHAVGHFIKTTGAKIIKVGLKIVSTIQKAASKVIAWIPVIGRPLSRVMDAEAEGENKLSDAIKVHIGGKLGHAMDNMSKAQKYLGYVPRELVEDISIVDHPARQLTERELLALNVALAAKERKINNPVT